MADSWEDWENDDFVPAPLQGGATLADKTKGELLLAKAKHKEIDATKFAGEDEGDEDEPAWKKNVPQTQQKKELPKKTYEDKGRTVFEQPLDDPIEEKKRLERLQIDADLKAAQDTFGGSQIEDFDIDLETFAPKSAKDYTTVGTAVGNKFVTVHAKSSNYKLLLKALLKEILADSDIQTIRDLESVLAGLRSSKVKEEKASVAAKKVAGKKKSLNVGRSGGSAGLDDYKFTDGDQAGEEDFM